MADSLGGVSRRYPRRTLLLPRISSVASRTWNRRRAPNLSVFACSVSCRSNSSSAWLATLVSLHSCRVSVSRLQGAALAEVPERETKPLTLPIAVRAWLEALRSEVEDATGAGEDAPRLLVRRRLGRLGAPSVMLEGRRAALQMLRAALLGVGEKG
jgi:hypothetical protein